MTLSNRLNQYRIMWLYVFFDLPTETKKERRAASLFRKSLLQDGFTMFQYSIYIRHCASRENAAVHKQRVMKILPVKGKVSILCITDRQFGMMETYHGKKPKPQPPRSRQLELF